MKSFLYASLLLFSLSSCATIFTGTRDTIYFDSDPQGATVYKDGVELCITPCSASIRRSLNSEDITIKLDDYETRVFTLDQEFNVVSVINLGFLLGWAVDAASGSVMRYDRKHYDLKLEKDVRTSARNAHRIDIDTEAGTVDIFVKE